jgi:hypothetical protein
MGGSDSEHEDRQRSAGMTWAEYIAAAAGYMGMGGGQSPVTNFLPLLLTAKSFSPADVGYAMSYSNVCYVFIAFGMAYVADRFNVPKTIVVVGSAGSIVAVWIIAYFAETVVQLWIGVLLFNAFFTPVNGLYDRGVLSMLGARRKAAWGSVRMVLSVWWGLGSLLASWAMAVYGWWVIAAVYSAGYVLVALSMSCMRPSGKASSAAASSLRVSDVATTIRQSKRLQAYVVCMMCTGMCLSAVWGFLLVFMQEMAAANWLMGVSALGMVSTEILVFAFSKQLLAAVSPDQLVWLAQLAMFVRMAGYGLMPDPAWTLLLNPLHGVSFACGWLASMQVFSSDFPPEQANSAVGVLNAVTWGVGPLVANAFTGNAYAAFGPRAVFCGWALAALAVCAWSWFALAPFGAASRGSLPASWPKSLCPEEQRHADVLDELPADAWSS